jgi:hypothetical protein
MYGEMTVMQYVKSRLSEIDRARARGLVTMDERLSLKRKIVSVARATRRKA